ncbi:hypothetical protein KP509_29G083800 [Ceratopteris richardii]|uniref:GBF-interacting protein 1 N-terminal domain-containing protein n=1 Tax=Ceratopteris richardii TaxID=49495 RepID=A0A8T2RB76_CERRI|nr:hypothetical protein KP509_29G083800 [Ceratopteris richardii]
MSGPKVANKAGASNSAIPAADRKLISTVKEVATNHSDEEIYAMLKECNRDPDDAAQRLLNQDNFHVVKRKRDKKKEVGSTKDAPDSRQANLGSYGRGSRSTGMSAGSRGPRRGASNSRTEGSGGRSRAVTVKENGTLSFKASSLPSGGSLSYSQLVQPKSSSNNSFTKSFPSSTGVSNEENLQDSSSLNLGGWPAGPGYSASTTLQGAWLAGAGHGTIADMLKGNTYKPSPPLIGSAGGELTSSTDLPANSIEQPSVHSTQTTTNDSAVNLTYEQSAQDPNNLSNQDLDDSGISRFAGDVSSYDLPDGDPSHLPANSSPDYTVESDAAQYQVTEHVYTMPLENHVSSASGYQNCTLDLHEGQSTGIVSQFSDGSAYRNLQFVESHQESSSLWNSEMRAPEGATPAETYSENSVQDGVPSTASSAVTKLQELNNRDNHSVIIPDHIRVAEADCTMLSFGSFDASFDGLPSNANHTQESESHSFATSETEAVTDLTNAMQSLSTSSITSSTTIEHEQSVSSIATQTIHSHVDVCARDEESGIKEEEELAERTVQHEYSSSYSVMEAVSSDNTSSYTAVPEETDSRPRDVNAVLPQYDNSTYYSGMFRSVSELDSRYSPFSQLAASGKLSNHRVPETHGQNASSEVPNTSVYPTSNTVVGSQAVPAVNNGPTTMNLPQQSMNPYATQPSGLPLGPYTNVLGYQYMPPGFSYVQSPYQQNYVSTSNYHQMPTAVGAGMKYAVPQYKASGPMVGGIHNAVSPSSLGYGGFSNSLPVANSPVTSGNSSSFDVAAASQHYKDNAVYLPNHQVDGPSVWLQSQLAREAQGSSYYNVAGQSQPARYSQTQSLLTHTHPAAVYGNLYHPQQSGSSPNAHQLLQQQQALGSVGALGTQIGSYQQSQRAQPTWAPGPY